MRIGFVGLGKLGLPCAEAMAERGATVSGYDIVLKFSERINVKYGLREAVEGQDIVFVATPTPHEAGYDGRTPTSHLEPKDFNYSSVIEVLKQCNEHMNQNQILVLISTVLPGTTRREFARYTTNFQFVYNPYLIAMGSEAYDMTHPDMVIIGTEHGEETMAAEVIAKFYKKLILNNAKQMIGKCQTNVRFKPQICHLYVICLSFIKVTYT